MFENANIADNLSKHAREFPAAAAVIEPGRTLSFSELDRAVWHAAAWFRAQGIRPGDVVAVTLGDSALHLVAGFALARIGAVRVQLPQRESPAYRERLAKACRAVALLAEADTPPVAEIRLLRPDPGWLDAADAPIDEGLRAPGDDRPWAIILTSGTTAAPKTILQSHADFLARRSLNQGPCFFLRGDRYLAALRLDFHLGFRMCMDALWFGASVVIGEPLRTVGQIIETIGRQSITFVYLVPSLLHQMLRPDGRAGQRLPGLRVLRTGGMVLPAAVRDQVMRQLSKNLVNGYGLNDLDCAISAADGPTQLRFPGSVGAPLPGVEVEVVDAAGTALPAGEAGEVRIRLPRMPAGYVDNPEATRAAFRDGWFHSGDLGAFDTKGMLYLKGRVDDRFNHDGLKIYPSDIEAALMEHPDVAEATAFAFTSERHQHIPVAAAVVRSPVTEDSLLAWCRERLGARAPRRIFLLDSLPRNSMGKIAKRELQASVAALLARERPPAGKG